MYVFEGRVKSLFLEDPKNGKARFIGNHQREDKTYYADEDVEANEKSAIIVKQDHEFEFKSNELFNFVSAHSREKLKIYFVDESNTVYTVQKVELLYE